MIKANKVTEPRTIQSERSMALMFRALKGESLSPKKLAVEYNTSSRTISRDIDNLKNYMAEHPELFGRSELVYSSVDHCWTLDMDTLLSNGETLAIAKILIGCRAFSRDEITSVLGKLEAGTSSADKSRLKTFLAKELLNYREPGSDCGSVINHMWKLSDCIENHKKVSIFYHKMDRVAVDRKLLPISIMYSEGYFYLIAFVANAAYEAHDEQRSDGSFRSASKIPYYFRIDRIISITVHRETFDPNRLKPFDDGYLRNRSFYMWPGPLRRIRFEFTGPSVQAILDKIPTAKIVERKDIDGGKCYTIEAETFGDGIKMFLMSQGAWVKVLEPQELVEKMREEVRKMDVLYK